jgi:hypothetical protein
VTGYISRTYTTRSSAVAAARNECKAVLGPIYEAAEGIDYIIHPMSDYRGPSFFELIGVCANPNEEDRALSHAAWERKRRQKNDVSHLKSQGATK